MFHSYWVFVSEIVCYAMLPTWHGLSGVLFLSKLAHLHSFVIWLAWLVVYIIYIYIYYSASPIVSCGACALNVCAGMWDCVIALLFDREKERGLFWLFRWLYIYEKGVFGALYIFLMSWFVCFLFFIVPPWLSVVCSLMGRSAMLALRPAVLPMATREEQLGGEFTRGTWHPQLRSYPLHGEALLSQVLKRLHIMIRECMVVSINVSISSLQCALQTIDN